MENQPLETIRATSHHPKPALTGTGPGCFRRRVARRRPGKHRAMQSGFSRLLPRQIWVAAAAFFRNHDAVGTGWSRFYHHVTKCKCVH